ncbi:MAG: hypothetical protein K0Q76_472, partial [Panacagrimonas sp.]|nr:hypothetical protein [Panacagrimonas sp.]
EMAIAHSIHVSNFAAVQEGERGEIGLEEGGRHRGKLPGGDPHLTLVRLTQYQQSHSGCGQQWRSFPKQDATGVDVDVEPHCNGHDLTDTDWRAEAVQI